MQTIELRKPILVNGKEISELRCDVDAVTVDGFMRAEEQSKKARQTPSAAMEFDYTFQVFLGFEGVMAAMPEVDVNDLKRITGTDLYKLMLAGRAFLTESEDSDSTEEPSVDASEPTLTSSRPASRK